MDIKLATDGDIDVTDGEVTLVTGIDAIRQNLEIELTTFLGEWFLNQAIGVPYFDDVFVKNPDQTILNTVFTRVIMGTPGVISLNELSFNLNPNRTLEIALNATTTEGVLDFTVFAGV